MIPLARLRPFVADREKPSPNHGPRSATGISLIVLHATADNGNEQGAEEWMAKSGSLVSCHLHIRRDGSVTRLVDDSRRAWHAGNSHWPGISDVNGSSLGWEIANRNDGKEEYTDEQYAKVAQLLALYLPQGISHQDVLSHHEVAPDRKTDPRGWDWKRMYRELAALEKVTPLPVRLDLDRIETPTPAHVAEVLRVRRLSPAQAAAGIAVAEVLLRGVINADPARRYEVVKKSADALSEWMRSLLPPAA